MSDCKHVTLTKLSGHIHTSGKNYVCACGEHFRVERWEVDMQMGTGNTETPMCHFHGPMTRIGENWTCMPCIEKREQIIEIDEDGKVHGDISGLTR